MKFFPLIWKGIWRRKVRTTFTILSVFVAFLLFGLLMTIRTGFSMGVQMAGIDRLIVMHKVSLIMPLPYSYQARLAATPGVEIATNSSWFGGIYQDPKNFFAQMAVEPEPFFKVHHELHLPDDAMKAWLGDRQGAVVGTDLASRFGWKVGDKIPLQATIFHPKDGTDTWVFNIVGIYTGDEGADTTTMYFRYDYLDENRSRGKGTVGWYIVKISDPSESVALAEKFDGMFANSEFETKTTTEKGFMDGFAKQIGDIGTIMVAILTAVLFTMLLVTANTMAQSVRERTSELAVLKTLGFSNAAVVSLVLAESLFVAILGGGVGLLTSYALIKAFPDPTHGMLPPFLLRPADLVIGAGLVIALGLLSGALPATSAMRLKIVDALRRN